MGKGTLAFRSQSGRLSDPRYCAEDGKLASALGAWSDIDGKDDIAKLKKIEAGEGQHIFFTAYPLTRNDKMVYQSLAQFYPAVQLRNVPRWPGSSMIQTT
jgi:hypothetical protein